MSTIFKLQQKLYMYYDIFLRDISISYLCERLDFTGSSNVVCGPWTHTYMVTKNQNKVYVTEMNKHIEVFSIGFLFVLAR